MFKNKPWKYWTTRKVCLILSILGVIVYVTINIVLNIKGIILPDTLTDRVFDYLTALPLTTCAITIAKVVKGKSNTDKDEINIESEAEEEIDSKREESEENVKEIESDSEEEVDEEEDTILENKFQKIIRGKRI